MIRRTFTCKDKQTIIQLYKSLVRPYLEYCVLAWRPYLTQDIDMLEKVQHRATKVVYGFYDLTYEQRLGRFDITTLESHRLREDLIEIFKIVNGFDQVDYLKLYYLSTTGLRDHNLKLFKPSFKHNVGKYIFSNRIIGSYNLLTQDIIECQSLNNFKKKLDRLFKFCLG